MHFAETHWSVWFLKPVLADHYILLKRLDLLCKSPLQYDVGEKKALCQKLHTNKPADSNSSFNHIQRLHFYEPD